MVQPYKNERMMDKFISDSIFAPPISNTGWNYGNTYSFNEKN